MAAMDADRAGGGNDARAADDTFGDAVAQGEDGVCVSAEISDGGEAGFERFHGVASAVDRLVGAGLDELVEACAGPLLAGDVDVAVDQAREDEAVLEVDEFCARRDARIAVRDRDDAAVADEDGLLRENLTGGGLGEDAAGVDDGVLGGGLLGGRQA